MADYSERAGTASTGAAGSRIQSDIRRLQELVGRVVMSRERVVAHARALGYFADTPAPPLSSKVSAISTTLGDVIGDLDRELDTLSGALNVFD